MPATPMAKAMAATEQDCEKRRENLVIEPPGLWPSPCPKRGAE